MAQNNLQGTIIKKLREERGITRQELSDTLRIPYSTLTSYENGTRTPPFDFLVKLADYLSISVERFTYNPNDGDNSYEKRIKDIFMGIAKIVEETDGNLYKTPLSNEHINVNNDPIAGVIPVIYKSFFDFLKSCKELYSLFLSGRIDSTAFNACTESLCGTYAKQFVDEVNYFDGDIGNNNRQPENKE